MLPFNPADDAFSVCPPIWLHANCEPAVVQAMKDRGWPQDDIDTWFRDWRDDEPNSEKEDEWVDSGIVPPPCPHPLLVPGWGLYNRHT